MTRVILSQTVWRWTTLVLLTLLTVSGCGRVLPSSAVDVPPLETEDPGDITGLATKLEPAPSQTTTAIPTQANPAPASVISPTSTRASLPDSLSSMLVTPCGVLLPLEPNPGPPTVSELADVEIPEDIIPIVALPAVQRILSAPDTVGLVAYQIGREEEGIYLNADASMPLASVVKILNLIAYAEAVDAGELDPGSWIPLTDLDRHYLPGMDLGSHNRAVNDLEERQLLALSPLSTPLEEVPWMMIRHSSNAAADYLHLTLGQERIERTAVALGLSSQTAPCPWIGQFLVMSNHFRMANDRLEIEGYIADRESYGLDVMRLAQAFSFDDDFRNAELAWRSRPPSIQIQKLFSEKLNAQASPRQYADLMARIIDNGLSSSFVNILVRRDLEWPMMFESNQEAFTTIGLKNGALPGILTTVYYAQRLDDASRVVVALFYRQLPTPTYRRWRRELPHDELARWLLMDPEAIHILRQMIIQ